MGLELTTDKYPPITSQTRYPLRHAASSLVVYNTSRLPTISKPIFIKKIDLSLAAVGNQLI